MEAHTFAMLSLLGVPAALIALVFLWYWLTPKRIWFSAPAQAIATLMVLGAIGAPVAITMIDSQGDHYENEARLVSSVFALPSGTRVNRQGDRTLRLGDCWRNAVNWRSDVGFRSATDFDEWYRSERYRTGLVEQIADYFGVEPGTISIGEGALDLRERAPEYQLVDHHTAYSQNVRIMQFRDPFVCAAIERGDDSALSLRACDPVSLTSDTGNAGQVIINPNRQDRTLQGVIYFAQGPHTCTNPLRRAVNDALGLPHPEGKPNLSMGGVLPRL